MPFRILPETYFLGRSRELESLYGIASDAGKGIAANVFLSGQYGVGKTELLHQLFNTLFWKQDDAAPFIYTVNPAMISASDFSKDYLGEFIRQRLAFEKKDSALINSSRFSLEMLLDIAEDTSARWAADMIKEYLNTKNGGDPVKLFLFAINAPYLSYSHTGKPVIAIIDEFQRLKGLYNAGAGDNKNLWMLFENPVKSGYTPHIISGSGAELGDMFFRDNTFGKSFELVNLRGLDNEAITKLFTSFCNAYSIRIDLTLSGFMDLFGGNPSHVKNFVQALRREGRSFSGTDLWKIYFNEITQGKIFMLCMSLLRSYMPDFSLRKTFLEILYHLSRQGRSITPSNLSRTLHANAEDLGRIINVLQSSEIIEMNFTALKFTGSYVLSDFVQGLYCREILEEPLSLTEETFINNWTKRHKTVVDACFEINIPLTPRAELVAVRALEQISKNLNFSSEVTGNIQFALIDLLTNIKSQQEPAGGETLKLKFKPGEESFAIEVNLPFKQLPLTGYGQAVEEQLFRKYTDGLRVEKSGNGTKITIIKELKNNPVSPS